jgi:hypothetical protein
MVELSNPKFADEIYDDYFPYFGVLGSLQKYGLDWSKLSREEIWAIHQVAYAHEEHGKNMGSATTLGILLRERRKNYDLQRQLNIST